MLIVDKIAMALSVAQYPTFSEWCKVHEYDEKSVNTLNRWKECKEWYKALNHCFTITELNLLFTLANKENI